ncbi:MAG TPA: carboxypeptidase regulatory-like domain-containing protein [Burkholderiaceae bacterium]|nr:carboxypeptidase regulatory-like domain-containing protein [Burkholderiaceae bacterium]
MKVLRDAGVAFASLLGAAISVNAAQVNKLPPEQVTGVASFISGGVSDGEVERFQAAFKQYPLIVELYEHSGARDEYTADANVRITDRKGATVLEQRAEGPFMLVRLPAGDYTVSASLHGQSLPAHSVHVTDSGHARSVFVFARQG